MYKITISVLNDRYKEKKIEKQVSNEEEASKELKKVVEKNKGKTIFSSLYKEDKRIGYWCNY